MNSDKLDSKDLKILEAIGLNFAVINSLELNKLKQAIVVKFEAYQKSFVQPIANTYPTIESANATAQIEHEASTGKISEQVMFYLQSRGIGGEECVSLIVTGFCGEILQNLPFEFAMEARELLKISMENSVG